MSFPLPGKTNMRHETLTAVNIFTLKMEAHALPKRIRTVPLDHTTPKTVISMNFSHILHLLRNPRLTSFQYPLHWFAFRLPISTKATFLQISSFCCFVNFCLHIFQLLNNYFVALSTKFFSSVKFCYESFQIIFLSRYFTLHPATSRFPSKVERLIRKSFSSTFFTTRSAEVQEPSFLYNEIRKKHESELR
jgi:hypothetical protein